MCPNPCIDPTTPPPPESNTQPTQAQPSIQMPRALSLLLAIMAAAVAVTSLLAPSARAFSIAAARAPVVPAAARGAWTRRMGTVAMVRGAMWVGPSFGWV